MLKQTASFSLIVKKYILTHIWQLICHVKYVQGENKNVTKKKKNMFCAVWRVASHHQQMAGFVSSCAETDQ